MAGSDSSLGDPSRLCRVLACIRRGTGSLQRQQHRSSQASGKQRFAPDRGGFSPHNRQNRSRRGRRGFRSGRWGSATRQAPGQRCWGRGDEDVIQAAAETQPWVYVCTYHSAAYRRRMEKAVGPGDRDRRRAVFGIFGIRWDWTVYPTKRGRNTVSLPHRRP
jgi:hypothetical protein